MKVKKLRSCSVLLLTILILSPAQFSTGMAQAPADTYLWHTFYGSIHDDSGGNIASSPDGGLYVSGWSYHAWAGPDGQMPRYPFPYNWDSYYDGAYYLLKLDSQGNYQWHSFYGGYRITVAPDGSLYFLSVVDESGLGPEGQAPLHPRCNWSDFGVIKLDSQGVYQWHTYYGGCKSGYPSNIAIGKDDSVYIIGSSYDSWLGDNDIGPLNPYHKSNTWPAMTDMHVLKLSSDGIYQWHTFYGAGGGNGKDVGKDILVGVDGGPYVLGASTAAWNGPTGEPPLYAHGGSNSLSLLKLTSSGAYQWHNFYASEVTTDRGSMATGADGGLYLLSGSDHNWLGPGDIAPLHAYTGSGEDWAVLHVDNSGRYLWHTFYGSEAVDRSVGDLVVDRYGDIYISGESGVEWLGPGGEVPLHSDGQSNQMTVLKLNSRGAYRWHTFYSAQTSDEGGWLALGKDQSIFFSGTSYAPWSGPGGAAPLNRFKGICDKFVLKLAPYGPVEVRLYLPAMHR